MALTNRQYSTDTDICSCAGKQSSPIECPPREGCQSEQLGSDYTHIVYYLVFADPKPTDEKLDRAFALALQLVS